jgi:hypothetical protein
MGGVMRPPALDFLAGSRDDSVMSQSNTEQPDATPPIDVGKALGAEPGTSIQCFTVYIPNKDRSDKEFGTQRLWVLEAIDLLTRINGERPPSPLKAAG